jgi:hypothetical protein
MVGPSDRLRLQNRLNFANRVDLRNKVNTLKQRPPHGRDEAPNKASLSSRAKLLYGEKLSINM